MTLLLNPVLADIIWLGSGAGVLIVIVLLVLFLRR